MTIGSRRRITREALFAVIPEYAEAVSAQAAERMFERDKAEILELGLDLRTETDPRDESVVHYRLVPGSTAPALTVTPAEYTVLLAASRAWDEASAGGAARRARAKLLSLGQEADPELVRRTAHGSLESLPVLAPLLEATSVGAGVSFRYRTTAGKLSDRHVEPWVVGVHGGHWYVLGHDRDRGEARLFRASRIESFPRRAGRRTVPAPPDADLAAAISRQGPAVPDRHDALLHISPYKALEVRDRAGADVAQETVVFADVEHAEARAAVLAHARWIELAEPAAWRAELAGTFAQIAADHAEAGGGRTADASGRSVRPRGRAALSELLEDSSPRARASIRTPSTSTDHLSRLIAEAAFVHSRGEVELEEMASEFGIGVETLIEDLQVLFVCGDLGAGWEDLIEADWEDGWVRVRNADALAAPLRLSPPETTALLAGLAALSPAGGAEQELLSTVRDKLMALQRADARPGQTGDAPAPGHDGDGASRSAADETAGPAEDEPRSTPGSRTDRIVALLQEALAQSDVVHLRYSRPDVPGTSVRLVRPEALETSGARAYLRAHDLDLDAERRFRIDRIVELLEPAQSAAPESGLEPEPEPKFEPELHATASSPAMPSAPLPAILDQSVWIRLEPAVAWVAEAFEAAEIRDLTDGSGMLARLQGAVRSALVDAVMECRGAATVIEPPGIRDEIVTIARGAAVRHGHPEPIG